ncbi:MAG: energy-coupling factor transporter transmembrane component T [Thermodesulfobacteriota bacterium]|nr:energy-coupling factor transporter transmembrane component T [Thermodesulfobacteriota bacterium]
MELKYFFVLLFFVLGARALTTPGDPVFVLFNLEVSIQGLKHGGLICTRFFTIMLMGIVFASTTKPSSVKRGVEWFLKPVPFIPEKQAAVMIMLFLRFLPLILQQAETIKDAHRARCADLEKNPVKRAVSLAVPLLKRTFLSADQLAAAMASRSYSQQRTDPEFYPSGHERVICLAVIFLSALLFLF